MVGFESPRLKIRFEPGEGRDHLRIFGPDGRRFLTFSEQAEEAKAATLRADAAQNLADELTGHQLAMTELGRADQERRRSDAAKERAQRLAARVRERGVEPE